MPKRRRSNTSQNDLPRTKKHCLPLNRRDHISHLSSELLIRILHKLPIETLLSCHSVSQRFYNLSHDSQLWKSLYYSRFVLPRAMRIPGIKNKEKLNNGKGAGIQTEAGHEMGDGDKFRFSSRRSRWLDEEGLRSRGDGKETNWKRQYKLRHNWARGACEVKEIEIAERGSAPSLLVRLAGGVVITVSKEEGLKAWELKGRELITACGLAEGVIPTCLAVDEQDGERGRLGVVVGFEDGSWGTWELHVGERSSVRKYKHPPSSNGMLSAVAYAHPYILSITKGQLLSFYTLNPVGSTQDSGNDDTKITFIVATTVTLYPSHSCHNNRLNSLHTPHLSKWLHNLDSRTTLRHLPALHLLAPCPNHVSPNYFLPLWLPPPYLYCPCFHSLPRPITISYAHPYILATHPDNTLSLYLCTSTHTSLTLSPPQKLFGHTSAISFASITSRGKAVSVSERGGELRVWELEPRMFKGKGDGGGEERSVRVLGEEKKNEKVVAREIDRKCNDSGCKEENRDEGKKLWVGFDEEMVIVLKSSIEDSGCECEGVEDDHDHGADDGVAIGRGKGNRSGNGSIQQRLVIYDFT
ncbi:hypothetical protein EYC80_008789 [Monilinia laxa]|uniref:F-box domain-containing protein n=1 Tax=Monilinia laxa TaxID=61186 RepID=A0A5N6K1H5_MONLA|nr:hypothetical protein EYC80_008789 [Monilinia laxa]